MQKNGRMIFLMILIPKILSSSGIHEKSSLYFQKMKKGVTKLSICCGCTCEDLEYMYPIIKYINCTFQSKLFETQHLLWGSKFREHHRGAWNWGKWFKVRKTARISNRYNQSKWGCKDQESIQLSTTPDTGYQWESDKLTVRLTKESQEVSPFPAGDNKVHINRRTQRHSKQNAEQTHKRSTKEVPPWNGQ